MSKHPYPQRIVDDFADYLKPYTSSHVESESLARQLLNRIWDSSRVDDLHGLTDRAIYVDEHGGVGIVGRARQTGHCDMNQPSTILYWGDSDE